MFTARSLGDYNQASIVASVMGITLLSSLQSTSCLSSELNQCLLIYYNTSDGKGLVIGQRRRPELSSQ
jgi:hypothetical protein